MENDMYIKSPFSIHVVSEITNFHIYAHGNRTLIEQGIDENGKFYKIYYQEENLICPTTPTSIIVAAFA
jgi:hypothetical protein